MAGLTSHRQSNQVHDHIVIAPCASVQSTKHASRRRRRPCASSLSRCVGTLDLIAQLQRRLNELLSTSEAIASSKAAALSKQLEIISAARGHIDKYKSRCITTLENCRGQEIIDLCEAIPGVLKQLECNPEHLSPCTNRTWTRTSDLESFKENIPHLCFISSGPVLESIKEEAPQTPWTKRAVITLCGQWLPTATKEDICVRVCESVCKNVNIVTPGSVLTFTTLIPGPVIENVYVFRVTRVAAKLEIRGRRFGSSSKEVTVSVNGVMSSDVEVTYPPTEITCTVVPPPKQKEAMLSLIVAGQHTSSMVSFPAADLWEWGCCGYLLVIPSDYKSTVIKPRFCPLQHAQSTAVATTQLVGDRVYEWHLSISDLEGACSCVAYGLIQKPFDQTCVPPRLHVLLVNSQPVLQSDPRHTCIQGHRWDRGGDTEV
ncbi:hypothetical protein Pelo_16180 [Pelomyxa schiedti]|nr:hypothetical protein Pelo_16180 [Pelomyxa schiedti]